ncbi:MAG: GTPase, partial [bacterium]
MSEEIDTTMARNRMERMTDLYDNLEDILDRSFNTVNKYINQIQGDVDEFDLPGDLPINVPDKVKGQLKGWINELSDEENFEQVKEIILDELMHDEKLQHTVEAIKGERPPRIMVLGRTGKGKSALINAICGEYVVETDPVHSVGIEGGVQRKEISIDEATNFELLDTEGYAEIADEKDETAREKLKQNIKEFHPDAILFVTNINDRDSFDNDTEVLSSTLEDLGGDIAEIPLITVLTHADQLPPNSLPLEEKQEEIGGRIEEIEELLEKREISANDIIPVSSRIDWSEDRPWELSEWGDVTIEQDHRENIDELIEAIADNIRPHLTRGFTVTTRIDRTPEGIHGRVLVEFPTGDTIEPGIPCEDLAFAYRDTIAEYGFEKESRFGYRPGGGE